MTAANASTRKSGARPFDFRRPNKLNRDHLRNLEITFETFARQCSTVLSSTLRAVSHVELVSIEQLTYDEYIEIIPSPCHLAVLDIAPLTGSGLLGLPPSIAFTVVDLLLGGHGQGAHLSRPLTEIEVSLVDTLLVRLLAELTYAFNSIVTLEVAVDHYESNPQFAQIAAPSDMTIVVSFEFKLDDTTDIVTLCMPYQVLHPVLEKFSGHAHRPTANTPEAADLSAALEQTVRGVTVEVSLSLPSIEMTPGAILALEPGDMVHFGLPVDQPVICAVGGRPTFLAHPARKGNRMAGQIVKILEDPSKDAS